MHKRILLSILIALFSFGGFSQARQKELFKTVEEYHQSFVSIDSHADTPLWFLSEDYNFGERHHPAKSSNKIDIPRMEEGGLDAVFLAAFVGQRERTPENYRNAYDKAKHGGLSAFGKKVLSEMNRIGIMVDVSHISDDAIYDVIKMTQTPIIASHSNARALRDHPRNLSDDMLKAVVDHAKKVKEAY